MEISLPSSITCTWPWSGWILVVVAGTILAPVSSSSSVRSVPLTIWPLRGTRMVSLPVELGRSAVAPAVVALACPEPLWPPEDDPPLEQPASTSAASASGGSASGGQSGSGQASATTAEKDQRPALRLRLDTRCPALNRLSDRSAVAPAGLVAVACTWNIGCSEPLAAK